MPPQLATVAIRTAMRDVPIRDLQTARLELPIADTGALKSIKVAVDIEHTFIGDLVVSIRSPTSTGVAPIILHNREGGAADNIKKTYDEVNAPGLIALKGKSPQGIWTLLSRRERRTREDSQLHP